MRGPRVHTFSFVLKERRESRILGLRFNQYSNSCRGRREEGGERKREGAGGREEEKFNMRTQCVLSLIYNDLIVHVQNNACCAVKHSLAAWSV